MQCWGDDTPDPGAKEYCTSQVPHFVASFTSCGKCLYLLAIDVHEHSEIRICGALEHLLTTTFQSYHFLAAINHLTSLSLNFARPRTPKLAHHFKVFNDERI
jgi:hypothetical protein